MIDKDNLSAALHEAKIYGIGATSDTNQKIILEIAQFVLDNADWRCNICGGIVSFDGTKPLKIRGH